MTIESINNFLNIIIQWTLVGVSSGFCLICVIGIWKWFLSVTYRAIIYFFPGLRSWIKDKRKKNNV